MPKSTWMSSPAKPAEPTTATPSPPRWASAATTSPSSSAPPDLCLRQGELPQLADAALEEVRASGQVAHIALLDLVGGRGHGLVTMGLQIRRPGFERPDVVLIQVLRLFQRKPCGA